MKYPMINRQPRREVNIPQLSGGINLRDGLTGIRDNQMTECINMWYKDGMLKTRPYIQKTNWKYLIGNGKAKVSVFDTVSYEGRVLVGLSYISEQGSLQIVFYWQGKNDKQPIFAGIISDTEKDYSVDDKENYFVVEKDGILYCYTDKFKIFRCNLQSEDKKWSLVKKEEIYIPTVLTHGKATNNGISYKGVMLEGYNLLTNSYKMVYSTVNLEDVEDGVTWMRYPYLSKLPKGVDTTIIAKLTTIDGTVCEHRAVWTGGKDVRCFEEVDGKTEDGLYLYVTAYHLHFVTEQGTSKIATIEKDDYVEDNLEVEIIYSGEKDTKELRKVFNMTKSIWFGGAANGISGGSRLFLCGNTEDEEKSLVLWSALNNPLYFSENNYVYVGNKSEAVTTFEKQGENLIIFKPNEIYYSYYAYNDNITGDDLINQRVVDYEANSVYFPMVQLNYGIGCNCPDTVQLCRNRLVWLNSNGKVYTLVSSNQYSEMTVYCVSEMVDKQIKEYDVQSLKEATSHDFEGYYVLMIGTDAYVMDYNSYGYTHIYGYSKSEDANVLIPWYFWKLNVSGSNVKFFGFKDYIFSLYDSSQDGTGHFTDCVLCNDKIEGFKEEKVKSSFTTKLFDFSAGGYLKNVEQLNIGFGNNDGVPINVSFITDVGGETEWVMLTGENTGERDVGFITVKSFYPTLRSIRNFGIKIECEDKLVVDGLSLKYRLLGGVR